MTHAGDLAQAKGWASAALFLFGHRSRRAYPGLLMAAKVELDADLAALARLDRAELRECCPALYGTEAPARLCRRCS